LHIAVLSSGLRVNITFSIQPFGVATYGPDKRLSLGNIKIGNVVSPGVSVPLLKQIKHNKDF